MFIPSASQIFTNDGNEGVTRKFPTFESKPFANPEISETRSSV